MASCPTKLDSFVKLWTYEDAQCVFCGDAMMLYKEANTMQYHDYVVLRMIGGKHPGDPYARPAYRGFPPPEGASLRVEVESLTRRDLAEVRRDPQVLSIAPPMPVKLVTPTATEAVEAPHEGTTWGVAVTGVANSPFAGHGVTVAVLDTGIDAAHEAFQGVELIQQDFSGEGNGDGHGHGTHCAGTIFGQEVNGFRFSMAPGVRRALIGKVLATDGSGSTEQICRAIQWAVEQGAHVVSMSLGFDFPGLVDYWVSEGVPTDLATSRALEAYAANTRLFDSLAMLVRARSALFQGTLLVAAAGNESKRHIRPDYELGVAPPAAAEGFISVGALQTAGEPHRALKVADFSNTGPNISGPGVSVTSAQAGGGYVAFSGTSMATPHVAGIAALWAEKLLAETGRLDVVELAARLIGRATKERLAAGFDPVAVGAGLVQAPLE